MRKGREGKRVSVGRPGKGPGNKRSKICPSELAIFEAEKASEKIEFVV